MLTVMAHHVLILAAIAVSCIAFSAAQACTRPTTKPTIPPNVTPFFRNEFVTLDVEEFDNNRNVLISHTLEYSHSSAVMRMTSTVRGETTMQYLFFLTNELLTYRMPKGRRGMCRVDKNLANNPQVFLRGGIPLKKGQTKSQPPSAMQVLHFEGNDANGDPILINYDGKKTVAGKPAHVFSSCQTWMLDNGDKFLAKVTHSFLDFGWSYPMTGVTDQNTVPLRMEVVDANDASKYDVIFNYFNAKSEDLKFERIETPPGVYCDGRVTQKEIPKAPRFIRFNSEAIDGQKREHSYEQITYDLDDKIGLARKSFKPNSHRDHQRLLVIDDFNTGLSYQIDEVTQKCDIKTIPDRDGTLFGYITRDGKVNQYSPASFLYQQTTGFEYLGYRNVRGLTAEVWAAEFFTLDGNVTIEWIYADPALKSWNPKNDRLPLKYKFYLNAFVPPGRDVSLEDFFVAASLYHVDYTRVLYEDVSIKPCLFDMPRNHIELKFEGAADLLRKSSLEEFKWSIVRSVTKVANVQWLRISDLRIRYDQKDIRVEFEILNQPPRTSVTSSVPFDSTLEQATQLLKAKVEAGQFSAVVKFLPDLTRTQAIQAAKSFATHAHTYPQRAAQSTTYTGYSSGAMAGLGIAMVLIGLGAGGGGSYFVLFKRGV